MNEKPTLISPKEVVRMMFQKMLGKVFIFNGVINVFTTPFPLSHIVIHRKTDLKDKTIFNVKPSPPLPPTCHPFHSPLSLTKYCMFHLVGVAPWYQFLTY